VLGSISFDLGTIQTDSSELQDFHLMGDHQNFYEQPFELRQKPTPETGNSVVVGIAVGSDVTESNRVVRAAFQLAT